MYRFTSAGAPGSGLAARTMVARIAAELKRVRGRTLALVQPLSQDALRRQVRDFMSPLLWDLGHIAEFERLWLVDAVEGRQGRLEPCFDAVDTPRTTRGELPLPDKAGALATLERVREQALALLERTDFSGGDALLRDGYVYRMVLQHEAQHQETMLQTLDLPADAWGYDDAAPAGATSEGAQPADVADDTERITIPGGPFLMGTEDRTQAYDNERGRHEVDVEAFAIERYPVSNRRWREFIDDGGYRRTELWGDAGAAWLAESGVCAPQGWVRDGDGWRVRRFGSVRPLDPGRPVEHVCYWEAEAFARWCGARLPSEQEWEKAASWDVGASVARRYPWGEAAPGEVAPLVRLESCPATGGWGPPPVGVRPALASAWGVEDLHGAVYQWTGSSFAPYPGFEAFPYDGYSKVFFGESHRVLRGSSWAADELLWRNTYRNWDLPQRRQIFAGVRLAYDA